jgi:hypothetical protein
VALLGEEVVELKLRLVLDVVDRLRRGLKLKQPEEAKRGGWPRRFLGAGGAKGYYSYI